MSPRPPPDPIPFLRLSVLTNQTPLPLFLSPLPMASPPPPLPSFPSAIADDAHSSSLDNIKPSVLIIVLILSITLFVSVSICLILRLLNGRCLRHLSPTSTTISTPATTSRVTPEHLQASSVLDSLPIFTFSSVTRRSAASAISGDCAVCLSKFEQNDQLRLLPLCCHAFHAECIDTWISSNQSCPLCRSPLFTSDSDLMKMLRSSSSGGGNGGSDSFRLEIGSVSRRQGGMDSGEQRMSYSIGSFDYVVDDESEVSVNRTHHRNVSDKEEIEGDDATTEATLAAEVAAGRSWLKDYVDRLSFSISSRAMSFRSSGRFFSGSSRRSEVAAVDWDDVEANRVGEEISELFRWISGV